MRTKTGLMLASVVTLAMLQVGIAADMPAATNGTTGEQPKAAAKTEHKTMKTAMKKDSLGKISGTVDNIDATANQIDVKSSDGATHQFMLTAKTQIMKGGKTVAAADVMKGDKVNSLRYNKSTKEVKKLDIAS